MIVVGGEALIDLVVDTRGGVTAQLGGGPFNVARTIGRLGGTVSFLGSISHDLFGMRLYRQLLDDGVDATSATRSERPTTLAVAEVDPHGAATYRFYLDGTSAPALDRVPAELMEPEAVHVGTLGLVLQPMAATLLDYLERLPPTTIVMLDPNCRARVIDDRQKYVTDLQRAARRTHIVKISTDDAQYLAPDSSALDHARAILLDEPAVRVVLVTDGADGTWVVSPDEETLVPTAPIVVADTIGAGDSFGGGFLAWWVGNGLAVDDISRHDAAVAATHAAQQVAALTCQQVGAEPPMRADLPAEWTHSQDGSWNRG